jgi:hypothetical protein
MTVGSLEVAVMNENSDPCVRPPNMSHYFDLFGEDWINFALSGLIFVISKDRFWGLF